MDTNSNTKNNNNNKKLKVALLFSGQARFFDSEPYESIKKHILDNPNYDCETFCHFWWDNGIQLKYECSPWNGWGELPIRKDTYQKLYDLYKPVSIKWNFPLAREETDFGLNTIHVNTPYNVRSMYTSLQRVYEQFEKVNNLKFDSNSKYDFIVRIRYDTILEEFPDLKELSKIYTEPTLFVTDKYPIEKYPESVFKDICVNECWFTNSLEFSNYLFNIKNHILDLYTTTQNISDEQLFSEYIKRYLNSSTKEEENKNEVNKNEDKKVVKLPTRIFKAEIPQKNTHLHLLKKEE